MYNILNIGLSSSDSDYDTKVIPLLLFKVLVFGFIYSFLKYNMLTEFY